MKSKKKIKRLNLHSKFLFEIVHKFHDKNEKRFRSVLRIGLVKYRVYRKWPPLTTSVMRESVAARFDYLFTGKRGGKER